MNLTTIERCKTQLENYDGKRDAILSQIIIDVSASAEQFMRRHAEAISRTEYFDVCPGRRTFQLRGYPVTSVTTIHSDASRSYGSDTLISSADYALQSEIGMIDFVEAQPEVGVRSVKVVYVGGMAATTAAFVTAFPEIEKAVRIQCIEEFRRNSSFGSNATSVGGGSVSYTGQVDFLDYVKAILNRFANMGHLFA
jgi:hypothetical protein